MLPRPPSVLTLCVIHFEGQWSSTVKSIAYKCIVQPILEYTAKRWNPPISTCSYLNHDQLWDSFSQKWSKSSDECLSSLRWSTLVNCRNYLCVPLLFLWYSAQLLLTFQFNILYQATPSLYSFFAGHYQLLLVLILCEYTLCLECYSILYSPKLLPFKTLWIHFSLTYFQLLFLFVLFCSCICLLVLYLIFFFL